MPAESIARTTALGTAVLLAEHRFHKDLVLQEEQCKISEHLSRSLCPKTLDCFKEEHYKMSDQTCKNLQQIFPKIED
jgi:hypothetical protein